MLGAQWQRQRRTKYEFTWTHRFFFFFWLCRTRDPSSPPGIKPTPQWKRKVLITGLPGKSQPHRFLNLGENTTSAFKPTKMNARQKVRTQEETKWGTNIQRWTGPLLVGEIRGWVMERWYLSGVVNMDKNLMAKMGEDIWGWQKYIHMCMWR